MRKYKLYLETSVWSFYYADDSPEKRDITRSFFAQADTFQLFIAQPVLRELRAAASPLKEQMLELVTRFSPTALDYDPEVDELAGEYLRGALPSVAAVDAQHIAYGTVYELDFVVSWNMKHIANVARQEKVRGINRAGGYTKDLGLISPVEVSNHVD